jgi:hypothetical protein
MTGDTLKTTELGALTQRIFRAFQQIITWNSCAGSSMLAWLGHGAQGFAGTLGVPTRVFCGGLLFRSSDWVKQIAPLRARASAPWKAWGDKSLASPSEAGWSSLAVTLQTSPEFFLHLQHRTLLGHNRKLGSPGSPDWWPTLQILDFPPSRIMSANPL